MRQGDFRILLDLVDAHRATRSFPKPKPSNDAAKVGLSYERRIGKELARHLAPKKILEIEHNPWFTFYDSVGPGNCSPDFLLHLPNGMVIVVEVKLTWVDIAMPKLTDLYGPVVSQALKAPTSLLVVCRNLTPFAPKASYSLEAALNSSTRLLHWPSTGHIQW